MGLTILAGRSKTGKSTQIYDDIKRRLKDKSDASNSNNDASDEHMLLIVPEHITYQSERDIIDRLNNYGIMETEILSFKRLSYKIFEEVGGLKLQEINSYGKIMLLKQVFEEKFKDIQVYKKASKQDGFLREFNDLIRELKENRISIEFIEKITEHQIHNELLKRKLSDILTIYKSLELKTTGQYYDEEDKTELFIKNIDQSEYIKNSEIWIDSFDSFDVQCHKVIEKLILNAKKVTISLNIDPDCVNELETVEDWEIFKTAHDTLKTIIKDKESSIEIIYMRDSKNIGDEIKHIEKNMFTVHDNPYQKETENINIYSSMNPYTETEKVASNIISLVRDQNYRWKDITVCVSDMDTYGINIKKIFTQYDIPHFMDAQRDIMDNPLIKYILSLLDLFIWKFPHDSMFEYLKTGYSPLNYNEVSKLENFALQYGIEGTKWFRNFKFKAKHINYYDELRMKICEDFKKSKKEFQSLTNASDITMFLFNFMKKHKVQEKIEKQVEVFKKTGMYEKSSENAQIWNSVIEIFDQITISASSVEITPKEYRKILESGFREVQISVIPPTIDKISVGTMEKSSHIKCKALFLMGANEGKLESNSDIKGLLLDDERHMLTDVGMKFMKSSNYILYREKHMLYKVVTNAQKKLYVSYSVGTVEGRALQPSMYIGKLKQMFPKIKEETDLSYKDQMMNVTNGSATVAFATANLRDYIEGRDINDIWKDVYLWYASNDNYISDIIDRGINYNNRADKINYEIIQQIYRMPLTVTVSKLENFAKCPFAFFVESALKPQPRKIQKIEMYDLGNIYHRAVEEFTNEIVRSETDINTLEKDEIYSLSQMCTDRVIQEKEHENTALEANERNKYMKEKIKRLVNRAAFTIIEQLKRGKFRPKFTELKIGLGAGYDVIEPVEIKISENQSIYLRGRIDRVDMLQKEGVAYVNIIDYKSSQKDIDLSDVVNGLQLQLIAYMSSIMKNGEKIIEAKPEIGGAYYFCIDDPIVDADNLKGMSAEDEIFKRLSLKGYTIEDMDIIENMDVNISETKDSDIISVGFKSDGSVKKTSKTLTEKEYKAVLKKADNVAKEICEKILDGTIDINPYKKDQVSMNATPCQYCEYKSVCLFDLSAKGNQYRKIKKQSKEEILSQIMDEENIENGMD